MNADTIQKRPYVFTCSGMSLDGKLAVTTREQSPIATTDDREILFDSRIRADAVMVGGYTLVHDDPHLTVKTDIRREKRTKLGKSKEPLKIGIISDVSSLNLSGEFITRGEAKKIIFTTEKSLPEQIVALKPFAEVYVCGKDVVDLKQALAILYDLGVKTLMVEGGGELLYSLFKDDLIDEINITHGNLILGGRNAPTLCDGEGFTLADAKSATLVEVKQSGDSLQLKYLVNKK